MVISDFVSCGGTKIFFVDHDDNDDLPLSSDHQYQRIQLIFHQEPGH